MFVCFLLLFFVSFFFFFFFLGGGGVVVVVVCLCVCCFYKSFQHGAVLLFGRLNGKFVFIEMPHLQHRKAAVAKSESLDFHQNKLSQYAFCFMHREWRMVS